MDANESSVRRDRALCRQYARHLCATRPFAEWADLEAPLQRLWTQQPHAMRWDVAKVVIRFLWALAPILPDGAASRPRPARNDTRR